MTDPALSRYQYAITYAKAARIINNHAGSEPRLLLPSLVCGALSLELFFKSLYYALNGRDFFENGRHTHDFSKIFDALDAGIKDRLNDEFQSALAHRDMADVVRLRQFGISIGHELKNVLEHWSEVFVKFRYAYDPPNSAIHAIFYPELEGALVNVIRQLRSEWPSP